MSLPLRYKAYKVYLSANYCSMPSAKISLVPSRGEVPSKNRSYSCIFGFTGSCRPQRLRVPSHACPMYPECVAFLRKTIRVREIVILVHLSHSLKWNSLNNTKIKLGNIYYYVLCIMLYIFKWVNVFIIINYNNYYN